MVPKLSGWVSIRHVLWLMGSYAPLSTYLLEVLVLWGKDSISRKLFSTFWWWYTFTYIL